jgi:hypothetical protein
LVLSSWQLAIDHSYSQEKLLGGSPSPTSLGVLKLLSSNTELSGDRNQDLAPTDQKHELHHL